MTRAIALGAAVAALMLAGCSVGPHYRKPDTPVIGAYKESQDWKIAKPSDPLPGEWWTLFSDPVLADLEQKAAASNQDVKAAEARFRAARSAIQIARSGKAPAVITSPSIAGVHASANRPYAPLGSPKTTGDLVLPFDLSYELDVWGRVRRTINASREEAQAVSADLDAVRLSVQAELAFDYFELRGADAQKRLLDDTVQAYESALQLTRNRFEGGAAPESEMAQAETQLEEARAQDTEIGVQRSQFEHAIAILIGVPPASFTLPPSPLTAQPPDIPTGIPSQLLERRPDIAGFERRVAEANEAIGLAKIAFFPSLVLSASAGLESSSFASWFNWPSRFWAIGPSAVETLFDAGRRRAVSEQATANYDALVAGYRQSTLDAFREVEDNLAALRILEQEAQQQTAAVRSARRSLELANNRYKGGVDNYLQVVTAQTIALANERNQTDLDRRRMQASVLLIKALGGGWDTTHLPGL